MRPNPLAKFDNQKTPVFKDAKGQQLYARFVTNAESVEANLADESAAAAAKKSTPFKLLYPIAYQTRESLIAKLKVKGMTHNWFEGNEESGKLISGEIADPANDSPEKITRHFAETFQKYSALNYTAAFLEDESGKPLCATAFTFNDPQKRECVHADELDAQGKEKSFIFFDLSQVDPNVRAGGLLKIMRNYVVPHFLVEAGFPKEVYMANSIKRMLVKDPQEPEKVIHEEIPNFIPHGKIFSFMGAVKMFERWRDWGVFDDRGRKGDEGVLVSDFFGENPKREISEWINSAKAQMPKETNKLEGCFMAVETDLQKLLAKASRELLEKKDGALVMKEKAPSLATGSARAAAMIEGAIARVGIAGRD
jgi:hypothetical protein